MFGLKINEFDNSDGTVLAFNEIFPNTPLEGFEGTNVEILDIVENRDLTKANLFVRNISRRGFVQQHDFGCNNFFNNEDFLEADNVRFKYYARDLDGTVLATAYNFNELSEKLEIHPSVLKKQFKITVDKNSNVKHKINITRKEL